MSDLLERFVPVQLDFVLHPVEPVMPDDASRFFFPDTYPGLDRLNLDDTPVDEGDPPVDDGDPPADDGDPPADDGGGTPDSDVLRGTGAPDVLLGQGGDDFIFGAGGPDVLAGGSGRDFVNAGPGRDLLFGGSEADVLLDGDGDDSLNGGTGADVFVLGDGLNVLNDFETGIDALFAPNFSLDRVTTRQIGENTWLSFSGSSTIILDTLKADVDAAIVEQTSGFVQINDDGWGDNFNVYAWAQEVFDGYLYVSTLNLDGTTDLPDVTGAGGLYRYDGQTGMWEVISTDGLGNPNNDGIRNLIVFNDVLYATTLNVTEGAEVLRSFDGINFEPVLTGGFGSPNLTTGRSFQIFQDALYVGFQSTDETKPVALLRTFDGVTFEEVTLPGADDPDFVLNTSIHALAEFDGYIYAATRNPTEGFELYRSADGTTWETVVGPGGAVGNGITTVNNTLVFHMFEYQGALYIGTGNSADGFGIYRTTDGTTFAQVGEFGFGDPRQDFAWRFHEFEGDLYLGTNAFGLSTEGGSIYRTSDGDNWVHLVGEDALLDGGGINEPINWGIRSFETYMGDLFVGTANYPYAADPADTVIGAQVFQFLGDPPADMPEFLF